MGPIRISFENLTILMAGIMFGPLVGMTVGICADVIGCIIVGYAINPLVTLGAASIGLISGSIYFYMFKDNPKLKAYCRCGSCSYNRFYDYKVYRLIYLFQLFNAVNINENSSLYSNWHR